MDTGAAVDGAQGDGHGDVAPACGRVVGDRRVVVSMLTVQVPVVVLAGVVGGAVLQGVSTVVGVVRRSADGDRAAIGGPAGPVEVVLHRLQAGETVCGRQGDGHGAIAPACRGVVGDRRSGGVDLDRAGRAVTDVDEAVVSR